MSSQLPRLERELLDQVNGLSYEMDEDQASRYLRANLFSVDRALEAFLDDQRQAEEEQETAGGDHVGRANAVAAAGDHAGTGRSLVNMVPDDALSEFQVMIEGMGYPFNSEEAAHLLLAYPDDILTAVTMYVENHLQAVGMAAASEQAESTIANAAPGDVVAGGAVADVAAATTGVAVGDNSPGTPEGEKKPAAAKSPDRKKIRTRADPSGDVVDLTRSLGDSTIKENDDDALVEEMAIGRVGLDVRGDEMDLKMPAEGEGGEEGGEDGKSCASHRMTLRRREKVDYYGDEEGGDDGKSVCRPTVFVCHFHSQYILYLSTEQGDAEAKPAARPRRRRPQVRPDWVYPVPFDPTEGDMWINTEHSKCVEAMEYRFLARNFKERFDEEVPADQQKKVTSYYMDFEEEELLSWLEKKRRLAGFNLCRDLLRSFPRDMYYKTDNGKCYRVIRKDHYRIAITLWNSLCGMTFDQGEVDRVNQANKDRYLAAAATGQGPLYNALSHGFKKLIRDKTMSISLGKKYQEMNSDGKVSALAAENDYVKEEEERFINDVHKMAKNAGIDYVQFATRESIIRILGGEYTQLGSDFDESSYYGCIVTNAPAMDQTMQCGGTNLLFMQLKYYMRAALCNPLSKVGGGTPTMPGDIYIFHSKYFHNGPTGEEDLKKCVVKKGKKYV